MVNENEEALWGKYYGSTTVRSHGQIVIPVEARRELGIKLGTKLLVLTPAGRKELILLKADALRQLVNQLIKLEDLTKQSTGITKPAKQRIKATTKVTKPGRKV